MAALNSLSLDLLRTAAHRLADGKIALDPLIDLAGDASFAKRRTERTNFIRRERRSPSG